MTFRLLLCVLCASVVNSSAEVVYQLRYTGGPKVQVEITLPRGADRFIMPRAVPMGYGEQPYDRFVENLRGWAPSGEPAKVERQEGPRWKLTPGAERIRYDVDVARMEQEILDASHTSKIRPRYVSLLGYSVLGFAEGWEEEPVRLVVHAPADWPLLSTLNPDGKELKAANFYALADSQILMGQAFQVRRRDESSTLYVAVYAEGEADIERIARLAGEAYDRVIAYFGSAPFPHYTVQMELLAPVSERHQYGFSMEHLDSSTYYLERGAVTDDARTRYNFAHHIAHAWVPKRAYGEGYYPFSWELTPLFDTIWFSEGFGQYAALEALVAGMPPEQGATYRERVLQARFRGNLTEAPSFLRRMSLVELSRVASTRYSSDFRTGRLVFSRGALMAAEMDDHIRTQSKGQKSLRDALRALMSWSAANKRGFRIEELPDIFRQATGVDVKEIMDRWLRPLE